MEFNDQRIFGGWYPINLIFWKLNHVRAELHGELIRVNIWNSGRRKPLRHYKMRSGGGGERLLSSKMENGDWFDMHGREEKLISDLRGSEMEQKSVDFLVKNQKDEI